MNLQEVQTTVNDFLKTLNPKDFSDNAINWGDLSCVEVYRCEDLNGKTSYTVLIEEAEPCNYGSFKAAIHDYLYKIYKVDFEVRTEW